MHSGTTNNPESGSGNAQVEGIFGGKVENQGWFTQKEDSRRVTRRTDGFVNKRRMRGPLEERETELNRGGQR